METIELYQLIGEMTYNLTTIDFVISSIAEQTGLVNNRTEFFARNNLAEKIKKIESHITNSINEPKVKNELIRWLAEVDKLRLERNKWVHSIVQVDANQVQFLLSNYRIENKEVSRKISFHSEEDLRKLNNQFIQIRNEGFKLHEVIKELPCKGKKK